MEFRYFSSVEGRLCPRFGKGPDAFIGAKIQIERDKQGRVTRRKVVWDEDRVVAIPENEHQANLKSYRNALRRGDLRERTAQDHERQASAAPAASSTDSASKPKQPETGAQAEESALDAGPEQGAGQRRRRRSRKRADG